MSMMRWLLKDNPLAKATQPITDLTNAPVKGFSKMLTGSEMSGDFVGSHYDKEDAAARSAAETSAAASLGDYASSLKNTPEEAPQFHGAAPGMTAAVGSAAPGGSAAALGGGGSENTWKQMMSKGRK